MVSLTSGWSGMRISPVEILRAGGLVGKDSGHQIVGAHALDRRRHFAAAAEARDGQRARGVPAPARREHRRASIACVSTCSTVARQEFEDDLERKRVLLAERDDDAVVGGGGLQLEIERRQKRLRSASPQARLMRAPNGAWITSCMPPASSKNRSATTRRGRHRAQGGPPARTYSTACSRRRRSRPHSRGAGARHRLSTTSSSRSSETPRDSSSVRPGASPRQNGMEGAAPWASSTRTRPASTRRIRQEVVPSRKISPAMLSTAKSSSSVRRSCLRVRRRPDTGPFRESRRRR